VTIVLALLLFTTSFRENASVPLAMVATSCGGRNVSPALSWSKAPAGTRSFALIVHDPDAGTRGFDHWVAYNIAPSQLMLASGRGGFGAGMDGRNDSGSIGYYGPCPPPGKLHHYRFTLYALDIRRIDAALPLRAGELRSRISGHVLAQATITGTWSATSPR
jgi:Raf kinase inhibitor-like YbhB/YbcL family protein